MSLITFRCDGYHLLAAAFLREHSAIGVHKLGFLCDAILTLRGKDLDQGLQLREVTIRAYRRDVAKKHATAWGISHKVETG
jgi:hypothetical protein